MAPNPLTSFRSPSSITIEQEILLQEYMKVFSKEHKYCGYAKLLLVDLRIYQKSFDKVAQSCESNVCPFLFLFSCIV